MFASKQAESNFRIILFKGKELKLIRSEVNDMI